MLSTKNWPENMNYLTCDNYTGSNTPNRSLDLRSHFVDVTEQATYGKFVFSNGKLPFNGYSMMKFDMDVVSVSIRNGIEYKEENLGNWTAGFTSPLQLKSNTSLEHLKTTTIYRISSVVVRRYYYLSFIAFR